MSEEETFTSVVDKSRIILVQSPKSPKRKLNLVNQTAKGNLLYYIVFNASCSVMIILRSV